MLRERLDQLLWLASNLDMIATIRSGSAFSFRLLTMGHAVIQLELASSLNNIFINQTLVGNAVILKLFIGCDDEWEGGVRWKALLTH